MVLSSRANDICIYKQDKQLATIISAEKVMLYSIREPEWIQNAWSAHIRGTTQTIMIVENQHLKVT